MSQTTRDNLNLFFKGLITVLLAITSFFLMRTINRVDYVYDSVIRLEEKMARVERDIVEMKQQLK